MQPVRMGIVGLRFGASVCEGLVRQPACPVTVVGVCDLDQAKAERVAADYRLAHVSCLEAMLEDSGVEAIGLFTPPAGRAKLIRQIIRAGKDVMTTKPFELDPAAAREVLEEARQRGRVVHLNSPNPRPTGEMALIHQWVEQGRLGRLTMAQAATWVDYHEQADGGWYDDPERCPVAPLFRIGVYVLNSLLALFPEPETVQVQTSRMQTGRPTPDNASVTIRCRDGAIITVAASFAVGGPERYKDAKMIGGTQGVVYYNWGPPRGEATLWLSTQAGLEGHTPVGHAGMYDWDFFARRVRGLETEDVTTVEQIVRPIRVLQAMARAEREGGRAEVV